jgi:hypothetical protein
MKERPMKLDDRCIILAHSKPICLPGLISNHSSKHRSIREHRLLASTLRVISGYSIRLLSQAIVTLLGLLAGAHRPADAAIAALQANEIDSSRDPAPTGDIVPARDMSPWVARDFRPNQQRLKRLTLFPIL